MNSKEIIFQALHNAGVEPLERPTRVFHPMEYFDPAERLPQALKEAAVNVVEQQPGETVVDIIAREYPEAKRIVSSLPDVSIATENPENIEDARQLDGVDVAVIPGAFAVLENGAIWVPRTEKHKALMFIAENLVILLDKTHIVGNMHDAMHHPLMQNPDFGCFIAGPSKTADIEQALVIGAHGARAVTVILQ